MHIIDCLLLLSKLAEPGGEDRTGVFGMFWFNRRPAQQLNQLNKITTQQTSSKNLGSISTHKKL
jgi:hypothetical protein